MTQWHCRTGTTMLHRGHDAATGDGAMPQQMPQQAVMPQWAMTQMAMPQALPCRNGRQCHAATGGHAQALVQRHNRLYALSQPSPSNICFLPKIYSYHYDIVMTWICQI